MKVIGAAGLLRQGPHAGRLRGVDMPSPTSVKV